MKRITRFKDLTSFKKYVFNSGVLSDYITVNKTDYVMVEYSLETDFSKKRSRWVTFADEDTLKKELYIDRDEETIEENDAVIDWTFKGYSPRVAK